MKLGPVTKLDKRNTVRSKKIDESCNVIVIFPIYSQFGAIPKPEPGLINNKTYVFNNSNFIPYQN